MSKLFFDNLLDLKDLEKEIKSLGTSKEEKEELWEIVDGIVSHKVMNVILANLPRAKHEEFLSLFLKVPQEEKLITYLKKNIENNFEELIKQELGDLTYEILQDFKKS